MSQTNLIRRLRRPAVKIARILLRREFAGRQYTAYDDDICLVAYPKSGNTWLRFLVGNLVHPQNPVSFANLEATVPSIYQNPDHRLRQVPRPRILKSHEAFFSRHRKVIYVVRDPRDVAVSYYHYLIKFRELPEGYPIAEYVPRFMREDFDAKFGPWDDHVLSWIRMRQGHPDFILLRYEDLLANPTLELARVADFVGIRGGESRLERAVELSSADRMRELERKQALECSAIRTSRQDMPFVRAATSGNFRNDLPQESIELIESKWGSVMRTLGYHSLSMVSVPKSIR
jgi:hypothetical protein